MRDFTEFEDKIGFSFNDKKLLLRAFVHRSYLNENHGSKLRHNERLEFLGDAVLELAVTHFLFNKYPNTPEGQLTAYRSALVRTESISEAARLLGADDYLLLSKGEARDTGKARAYILANTFEAIVGAIYMDQGYEPAEAFIKNNIFHKIDEIVEKSLWRDAKSFAQEKAQEVYSVTPSYELLSAKGPDHAKVFTVAIFFGKKQIAEGSGRSKQDAQQEAARKALESHGWV